MQRKSDLFDYIIERPRLSILTGVLFILMGILVSNLPKMIATLGWSTTSGIVTSRQIQSVRFQEYDGDFYEEIHVSIHYEYVVGEATYVSQPIDARNLPYYPSEIAEQYPVDKVVTVYYNPRNPAEAVLEPGIVGVLKAFDVFSYLFWGAGIYFIRTGILKRKEAKYAAST